MELATGDDLHFPEARRAVFGAVAASWASCLVMPVIAVVNEPDSIRQWLGGFGLLILTVSFAATLHAVATPSVSRRRRRLLLGGFAVATLLSIVLVAPVGAADWYTWAWIGGATAGFAPVLLTGPGRWVAAAAGVGLATAVGAVTGGTALLHTLIAASIAGMIAVTVLLPFWLWTLLQQARAGREAQARLAVTEERLRFARDVHDVLGHRLSIITLKAELAARLSAVDPDRSAREAAQVQHLSASALNDLREAVHGYRTVDLGDQLQAVESVLRDAGIHCTAQSPAGELPTDSATQLALALREGCTNVLRHSTANWCTIEVSQDADEVRMSMANDGARIAGTDGLSFGLRGTAERLAGVGGSLRTRREGDVFRLEITVPTS